MNEIYAKSIEELFNLSDGEWEPLLVFDRDIAEDVYKSGMDDLIETIRCIVNSSGEEQDDYDNDRYIDIDEDDVCEWVIEAADNLPIVMVVLEEVMLEIWMVKKSDLKKIAKVYIKEEIE